MTNWSLIESPPRAGAWNMAVDEALLYTTVEDPTQGALRLYSWNPACCSIGRYQRAGDLEPSTRARQGELWVRRLTGGRALYHGRELTYCLIAPIAEPRVSGGVLESYRKISYVLGAGLALLGVEVETAGVGDPRQMRSNPSCFDNPSAYEILYGGRKLVGSAQYRHGGVLLQHGSILLDDPSERFFAGLNLDPESMQAALEQGRARLATLTEALGRAVELEEVASAVAAGFANAWGVDLVPRSLTPAETVRAVELERDKYRSESWNCLR